MVINRTDTLVNPVGKGWVDRIGKIKPGGYVENANFLVHTSVPNNTRPTISYHSKFTCN